MEEIRSDRKIDLRGVSCPLNYVKTKLKLEEMEAGQVLEVLLDDGESIISVPRSAKEDGFRIVRIEQVEDHFKLLLGV